MGFETKTTTTVATTYSLFCDDCGAYAEHRDYRGLGTGNQDFKSPAQARQAEPMWRVKAGMVTCCYCLQLAKDEKQEAEKDSKVKP